jgi:hypothetical protein
MIAVLAVCATVNVGHADPVDDMLRGQQLRRFVVSQTASSASGAELELAEEHVNQDLLIRVRVSTRGFVYKSHEFWGPRGIVRWPASSHWSRESKSGNEVQGQHEEGWFDDRDDSLNFTQTLYTVQDRKYHGDRVRTLRMVPIGAGSYRVEWREHFLVEYRGVFLPAKDAPLLDETFVIDTAAHQPTAP